MFTSSKELTPGVERAWPPIVDKIEYKLYLEKFNKIEQGTVLQDFWPACFLSFKLT